MRDSYSESLNPEHNANGIHLQVNFLNPPETTDAEGAAEAITTEQAAEEPDESAAEPLLSPQNP